MPAVAAAAFAALLASLPLAIAAQAAARPFRSAATRYCILASTFVLVAAVGPLVLAAARLREAPPAFGPAVPGSPGAQLALTALLLAAGVALALLAELAFDVVKLRRVKRAANPFGTVGVRRARIGTSAAIATPTAIGYLHPAVLLPDDFGSQVDAYEWDAVVAHECAHLARRDDWAKAIQSAVLRLGWWLPGLWILGRALDLERELASDERAAGEGGARRYAACLLRLATDRCTGALAPAFGARRSHVAIRVERLVRPVRDGGPLARATALGTLTAAAFAIIAAAVVAVPGTGTPRTPAAPRVAPVAIRSAAPRGPKAHQLLAARRPVVRSSRRPAAWATPHQATAVSAVAQPAAVVAAVARPAAAAIAVPQRTRPFPPPARRLDARPVRAARPAPPPRTLAFVAPGVRCRTCFGPLRSPDDAVAPGGSFSPPATLPTGSASAVAADDATSGPVSLGAQMFWFRFPARGLGSP